MDNTLENHLTFKNDSEYSGFDESVSKSRRSSILKPPKARAPLLEVNYSNKKDSEDFEANRKRRVSFAGVNKVKEFNSKVGTIHVSNTPSYDELFSSSDSSEILQSESCDYHTQTEDAKTEKEARLIMNIISRDDSCASLDASVVDNESNDNIDFDIKNTSSFNPQTFDCLNDKQDRNKCLSESYNESNEGMDLTQPIHSDKMQESLADMSLEPNLMSEMQISSDARAGNNCMKETFHQYTASCDSQLPLNILQNLISSSEVTENVHKTGVENSSKEIPKRVELIYGQPRKKAGVENISSDNQQFTEPCFKLAQETCKAIPLNHSEMDNDLNTIDMEFTEALDRIEGIQNNLMEKQKMVADVEKRVSRKSMINTLNFNALDDSSNMDLTDVCILKQLENNWHGNTLFTNMPTSKNSTNMEFVENACILKSSAKMLKEDDSPVVQDNDCSFSMELTEAYTVKSTEINFPFKIVFKSEGSSQKHSEKSGIGNPHDIINCSSNNYPQDHNISTMEVTETCVNKPAGYIKSNIFMEAPENECSSNMEFTKANVEFPRKKENRMSVPVPNEILSSNMEITGNCSVKPSENDIEAHNTENILVNECSSHIKFSDASSKSICKYKNDRFKHTLNSENALVRNTESHLVMVSEGRLSLTQDRELNCSMEFTEVCIPKPCEKSMNFFRNNQQNPNISCGREFTKACAINPVAVPMNSVPLTKDHESTSNMELTDACEINPSNVAKNTLPFSKGELSDMEFTEACKAIPSDITRNDLPFTTERELSNVEFTDTYVAKPPDITRNDLPSTKDSELSNMEFTDTYVAKPPHIIIGSLPFTKSCELSSNMEFTEANLANSPEVTKDYLPITKSCQLPSDVEFTEAYMTKPPDVGGGSLPSTKSRELSSNMEFTEACIISAPNAASNSLPFMNDCEISSTTHKLKNVDHSNSSDKPLDSMHEKSVQDTSAGMELSTSLNKIDTDAEIAPRKISDDGSKGFGMHLNDNASITTFMGSFQKCAENTISLKMGDIPSTAKTDENQESNLINFSRSISYLKDIGNCDFADTSAEYVPTDINKSLNNVGINFSNNEHKESDFQTMDMDITYSGKLENNEDVLSNGENGGRKNITETLDNSDNDELDNEKQLLLKESIKMDMNYSCQPPNRKVDSNESFPVRSKAKLNVRNSQADIEGNMLTTKAKIVLASSNKNLYEASKVNIEIVQCSEEINLQQEQIEGSNAKVCESQKLQKAIKHDSHLKKNYSNGIPTIFEEQYKTIRSKNIFENTANKLEEISDKEITKNTSKENEIHVHAVQSSDLSNNVVVDTQKDCFHLYDVMNAEQRHLAEIVENGSAQDHHMNYTSSRSISDNTATLVNTDLGNSQVQQNNYEMIEVGGKVLSKKHCEKFNLSIGEVDDLGTKEEISVSHRDKQGFISNSNRISQPAMGAIKNVEGKTVVNATNAKDIVQAYENEAEPSEQSVNNMCKDNKIERNCLQVGPTFSLGNSIKKTKTTREGTLEKEGASFSSSYLQSVEYRNSLEQYKLNVQNLKFMSDLGFSRISFTEWRYNLTETLSIVFNVPNERIDVSTCLKRVNYDVNKHSDSINLYISEVIKNRYTEEWLKSECITVKDVLQTSDIIMKERSEIKKFYMTVNYLYRFYPCKFNKNRISFYIIDIKAGLKFDVDIYIDGWKKIKAENIKVISSIGHFREQLVRRLFTSISDDEKRLINFVRILEDYCKSQNNAI